MRVKPARAGVSLAQRNSPSPEADQQRRRPPGHHQGPRSLGPDQGQGIGALQQRQHVLHRLKQQPPTDAAALLAQLRQAPGHEVGNHLGVGVGTEHDAAGLKLLPEAAMVLDDAVLDHRQTAAAIEMGMGVALLRLAMGGPAGMADAAVARGPLGLVTGREIDQLPLGPEAVQQAFRAARIRGWAPSTQPASTAATSYGDRLHGGDAGRVIAAVFQLAQPFQQLGSHLPRSDQGNDAAHRGVCSGKGKKKPGGGPS